MPGRSDISSVRSASGRLAALRTCCACVVWVALAGGVSASVFGGVGFDHAPVGTTYGSGVNAPGDVVFFGDTTSGDLNVRVREFDTGTSMVFGTGTLGGFAAGAFATDPFAPPFDATPITLSNLRLELEYLSVWDPSVVVATNFAFADFGGKSNLVVNGESAVFEGFENAPATLGGTDISVRFVDPPFPGAARGWAG